MTASNDLPPIGSLWLHEDGDRRFVTDVYGWPPSNPSDHSRITAYELSGDGNNWSDEHEIDWLAWQAKAVRIDREDAHGS